MDLDLMIRQRPEASRVHELLQRYMPVRLQAETKQLQRGDLLALEKLIEAARSVDPIYWRQRSKLGWNLLQELHNRDLAGSELARLLTINYGPWDNLNGDVPFWGKQELAPGAGFYAAHLTREKLDEYLDAYPEQRSALLSPTTLVEMRGDRLYAVPYEKEYEPELQKMAAAMREATEMATDTAFRRYLASRASGLCSGELQGSERRWVEAAHSPVDLLIGPYEVYDDSLKGVKRSYEAAVLVRHALSERMEEFERDVRGMGRELPGAVADDSAERKVRIGVFDVVFAAGMLNMGSKAIAVALPNDEEVRRDTGSRLLLFRNVIEAKFDSILEPLAERVLCKADFALVNREAFLYQTLLHETGHVIGSEFVQRGHRVSKMTVRDALGERYSTIEESRADLLGMRFLGSLIEMRKLPTGLGPAAATTFVVSSMRAVRFGDKSDHARAAAIGLSHLHETGAIRREGDRLRVEPERVQRTLELLAERVQAIASAGDYGAAGRIIAAHSRTPPAVAELLVRTRDIPVDLEFTFDAQLAAGDLLSALTG